MKSFGVRDTGKGAKTMGLLLLAGLLLLPVGTQARKAPGEDDSFTSSFRLQDCRFETTGRNPYFILQPGRQLVLEGEDEDATVTVFITVLWETRDIVLNIGGRSRTVRTRVVEEREFADGELKEVSRNFFAGCAKTNDVFYFGEDVDIYEGGEIVSHDGAWLAGDGAMPGIVMPGTFLLGSRYFQEIAPGIALDRAEHVAMGVTVRTPFGVLEDCVVVRETSPLEPGSESMKAYCPRIGLAIDDVVQLIDVIEGPADGDDDN